MGGGGMGAGKVRGGAWGLAKVGGGMGAGKGGGGGGMTAVRKFGMTGGVSLQVSSPFVVNLYYAFQTNEKLCFVLDLMNGGDLHYHLTQHGVFNEDEV